MFYRSGRWLAQHKWWVIALWVLLLLFGAIWAPQAPSKLTGSWGEMATESRSALNVLKAELGASEASLTVVFRSQSFPAEDPRFVQGMEQALAPLKTMPQVTKIVTFYDGGRLDMVSADRSTTYALVVLKGTVDEALDVVPQVREKLRPPEGMELWLSGTVSIFADVIQLSHRDLQRAEMLVFPVVLVALLVVFGSLMAAGVPIVMGGISILLALTLTYFLSLQMEVSVFVLNIVSFLGIGLAIDYSLFIVSRFREELRHHNEVAEAVAVTLGTAGRAVLFSGLTVMLGLSGLFFFGLTAMRSLGFGGIAVTFLSLLVALTLLPALMALLGHRINALSLFRKEGKSSPLWRNLARWGGSRPWLIVIPVGLFLLALGSPLLSIKMGLSGVELLPPQTESRQGWDLLTEKMGKGNLSPITLVARSETGVFQPAFISALYDYVQRLRADPRVTKVESLVSLDPRLSREQYLQLYSVAPDQIPIPQLREAVTALASQRATQVRVFTHLEPTSSEAEQLVREIRQQRPPQLNILVTGITADLMDDVEAMYADFPWVILFVMAAIYVALLILFRSVFLPLKATVMNLLSLGASYGALVFIFQQGHFQKLLGFEALGITQAITPIIMFSILFGLSMDYEVFLLSRMKESYEESGDNAAAVARGLERTGAIITNAALILALVAAAFATSYLVVIKALGVGIAIAVLTDALVVRMLLVPALMHIMGKWNWWLPAFLARFLPRWQTPR